VAKTEARLLMGERKMSNEDWWKPENLKSSEQAFIENESLEALDTGNDFGSYKIMRLKGDIKSSQIMSYNDLQPRYRVSAIKKNIRRKQL